MQTHELSKVSGPPRLAERHTVCNRDCPDACALVATVDEVSGRLVRLAGDPNHPVTKGFICYRTSQFPERQYSPDRVTTPLLKRDGRLQPISWEEAIWFCAERLLAIRAESGPASILYYRSGGSLGLLKSVVDYFFELFGPVTWKRGDICSGGGDAAQEADFGDQESHDLFDILNSRNILLWGKNPYVSNIHLIPPLRDARRNGTKVILIDPVRHKGASLADRVIQPRPGGDFALAMGAAARLFELSAIDPEAPTFCNGFEEFRALALSKSPDAWAKDADVGLEDVREVAAALAGRPCSIQVGWGMGRRMNGSAIVRALDALGGLSGNIGIPGGGVSFYYKRRGGFDTSFLSKNYPRTLSEPLLGQEILTAADPPIRAVWITAGNPVAMLPDSTTVARALETRELVVVVDSFLTDTARRATLVLPTTTLVEDEDLLGAFGHHWLGSSRPVVEAPEGVLSDLAIVQRLAKAIDARLGSNGGGLFPRLAGSTRDWKDRLLRKVAPHGVTVERLEGEPVRNPLAPSVLYEGRKFPTPSGLMNLVSETALPPPDEPGFPLWLFSNSTEKAQSSQWAGSAPEVMAATVHPDAVSHLNLPDGGNKAVVYLESEIGRLPARLTLDRGQRRDIVLVPKGGHLDSGTCANALIKARLTDAGEGAAYQDCRVRIVAREAS